MLGKPFSINTSLPPIVRVEAKRCPPCHAPARQGGAQPLHLLLFGGGGKKIAVPAQPPCVHDASMRRISFCVFRYLRRSISCSSANELDGGIVARREEARVLDLHGWS